MTLDYGKPNEDLEYWRAMRDEFEAGYPIYHKDGLPLDSWEYIALEEHFDRVFRYETPRAVKVVSRVLMISASALALVVAGAYTFFKGV